MQPKTTSVTPAAESAVSTLPASGLDAVSGGAFPTSVNDQITDAVT